MSDDPTQPNNQISKVTEVQAKYADDIMAKANVVGVGVGMIKHGDEPTNEVGLVVLVSQKVPLEDLAEADIIPKKLDGVSVDVQETGVFSAGGFEAGG